MHLLLAKNWWSLLIRGLTAIGLGAFAMVARDIHLSQLALAFFGYALIDGLVGFAGAVNAAENHQRWGSLLSEALVSIAAALVIVGFRSITYQKLIYSIAAWALLTGIFETVSALRLRRHIQGEWLMALSAFASLLLGIVMIALPLASPAGIALWVGLYAVLFGVLLIGLGFRMRAWSRDRRRYPRIYAA